MNLSRLRIVVLTLLIVSLTGMSGGEKEYEQEWVKDVGSKTFPEADNTILVNDFGAINNGLILCTKAIQAAIDQCAEFGGGMVVFEPGVYLTGAIYLKSNVNLHIGENVELRGIINLEDYPDIDTRVAGIEMKWPSAIINVLNQKNVAISGKGIIHAQGRYHWERYWKLRQEYTPLGLRWASDYDCKRVRTILVSDSEQITIKDLTLKQAGFWTVHLLYSNNITVDGITILNNIDGYGPSTDGIDIDSSTKILVENCVIDCNDDNFCLKSGRDADGLRVNRPTEYVIIRNCVSLKGGGLITFGSETSGGIRNILVHDLVANETNTAIRFKSALTRGGELCDINIYNIKMKKVKIPFEVTLNWNPSYSYASIDEETTSIPDYWKTLLEEVPPEKGLPVIRNVTISDIKATDAIVAMSVSGLEESYIENFTWSNIDIKCEKPGKISYTKDGIFNNVNIKSKNGEKLILENNINLISDNSNLYTMSLIKKGSE